MVEDTTRVSKDEPNGIQETGFEEVLGRKREDLNALIDERVMLTGRPGYPASQAPEYVIQERFEARRRRFCFCSSPLFETRSPNLAVYTTFDTFAQDVKAG